MQHKKKDAQHCNDNVCIQKEEEEEEEEAAEGGFFFFFFPCEKITSTTKALA
jgi:hypothetical protein